VDAHEWLESRGVKLSILNLGLPDDFLEHATREDQLRQAGLDADGICAAVQAFKADKPAGEAASSTIRTGSH